MSPVSRDTSFIEKRSPNLAAQFRDRVAKSANAEAFRIPAADGQPWTSITWKQAGDRVEKLAAGLLSLGIESEQRVGIAAGTRLEWIEADLAVLSAGAATTTVYPSTMAADVAYILADSGSRLVFAEDDEQVQKLRDHKSDLPDLFKVVLFDGEGDGDWVITLEELAAAGEKYLADHPDAVDNAVAGIKPEQLATLIYTSGTTGKPKGVRLTHASWTYEGAVVQSQKILDESDLQFLWLPMAHSFGKVLLSAQLACGFATAIDGRVDRIIDNVGIVKPTFMGAAPRIFEKAYARIITMQEAEGGLKEKIFTQAFVVGRKVDQLTFAGKPVPVTLRLQHALFDKLVFAKIRDRFGGRVRFFLSGSAALNRDIAEWFHAAGLLILEGYGLTETSAGAFVNSPDDYKIGTV
ncbi:MAG: AMP-dependent synthetase/ligase, partial [Marmoricola sp.]